MNVANNRDFYEKVGFGLWDAESYQQDRVIKLYKILSKILKIEKPLNVIDIACGNGGFINTLSQMYPLHKYYGSDIASNVIEQNKIEKPEINWYAEDCNVRMSYKDNFFDVVIAGEVLEHLYDTDYFIHELYRIIKPGGFLLLTTPNLASWLDRITLLLGLQPFSTEVSNESRIYGRKFFYRLLNIKESQSAGHLRCFTRSALKDVFRAYSFEDIVLIPCHIHNFALNRFITRFIPPMSQTTILIGKKLR